MASPFLIPDLVDHVFQYLKSSDLYTCLFVNRQFNAHAHSFLWGTLRFSAGFTAYYSSESHKSQVNTCLLGS